MRIVDLIGPFLTGDHNILSNFTFHSPPQSLISIHIYQNWAAINRLILSHVFIREQ